ncbi:LPS-assembly protein LptD [Nisaea denitrificans]|uniref:LPS-assembly protein LptD n=1 Tax=Nisaea denitrificans TaxID=390877 RepID=UPI000425C0C1|nr:LPS assembly protein LptD [Nisaea denitrificans]
MILGLHFWNRTRRHLETICCHVLVAAVCFSVQATQSRPASAQESAIGDAPVLMVADELVHDETLGTITARGNVELSQNDRVLLADSVTYNQREDTVIASGNISLLEPTGEVIFSDYAELQNELKTGVIDNIRLRLTDGSRFAANRGTRTADQRKILSRAVFTPCESCKEDASRPPLWQIKARKIVHDEVAKDIIYNDATLEMFGVPVLYTPYLAHPDPTVDRRSGFLAPLIGTSDELGFIYGQPYYQVIDESKDLELMPIVYSEDGGILKARYRQRFADGLIDFQGTAGLLDQRDNNIETGEQDPEGSVDLEGRFDFDPTWRGGFDLEQSSGRTYLRRYRLDSREVLTSRAYAEGFRGRNYTSVQALKFQGLNPGDSRDKSPTVAPLFEYSFVGEPDPAGGRFQLDATAMSLTRETGADSRKIAIRSGWSLPYIAPAGDIYTLTATLDSDFYQTDDLANGEGGDTGRLFPQVGMNWRYPLAKAGENYHQTVEPIVNLVLSPNGGNPDAISNEDSQSFLFDDTNLFRMNRFTGSDRVTSGSRVDYGFKTGVYGNGGGSSSLLFGQSYQFFGDGPFEAGSGLDDDLSDYVGRVHISPSQDLDFLLRFRLDKDDFTPRRSEIGMRYQHPRFSINADYVLLDDETNPDDIAGETNFLKREQLDISGSLKLSEFWSANGRIVQDFSDGANRTLIASSGLVYADECFTFGLVYERSELEDDDIEPEQTVMLRIAFKHLGGFSSN